MCKQSSPYGPEAGCLYRCHTALKSKVEKKFWEAIIFTQTEMEANFWPLIRKSYSMGLTVCKWISISGIWIHFIKKKNGGHLWEFAKRHRDTLRKLWGFLWRCNGIQYQCGNLCNRYTQCIPLTDIVGLKTQLMISMMRWLIRVGFNHCNIRWIVINCSIRW